MSAEEIYNRLRSCPELQVTRGRYFDTSDPDFSADFRIKFHSWDHDLLIHQVLPGESPDRLTCWLIPDVGDFRLWDPLSWMRWTRQQRSFEALIQLLEKELRLLRDLSSLTSLENQ